MADLTVGRAGRDVAVGGDGIKLVCESWERDGDEVTVRGRVRGSEQASLAAVKAAVAQLQGYGAENADEPVVPVTWAQDPSVDGFYRVVSCRVSSELTGRLASSASGKAVGFDFTLSMQRVPGWQSPLVEVYTSGALRSNSHSVTNGTIAAWVAIPGGADTYYTTADVSAAAQTSSDGAGSVIVVGDDNETGLLNQSLFYRVDPADYYLGAARIEYTSDGTNWYQVTGTQVTSDASKVRVGNGRVRAMQEPSASDEDILVQHWDSAWEDATFETGIASAGVSSDVLLPSAVTVIRNSPEACTIQLDCRITSTNTAAKLTLTVLRGSTFVEAVISAVGANGSQKWAVWHMGGAAGTSITGGLERTSADANGNKWFLSSPSAITRTAASGVIELTAAATAFPFAMAASRTALSAGVSQLDAYYTAVNHRQTIAAR